MMAWVHEAFHFLSSLDQNLDQWLLLQGAWVYAFLFVVVFCETGLVIAPFLPGDSLLFAVGSLCGRGGLSWGISWLLLCAAALAGDMVNYQVGRWVARGSVRGRRLLAWIKPSHLKQAHDFFEKHGGKAIFWGRWVPLFRTVAPFVAGMGKMSPRSFVFYNVFGGLVWVTVLLGLGYKFGSNPIIQKHLFGLIMGIVGVSLLPPLVAWLRARYLQKRQGRG